jgi:pullulanase
MSSADQVKSNLKFLAAPENVIAYSLNGKAVKDSLSSIVVIHNANPGAVKMTLPNSKKWSVFINGAKAGTKVLQSVTGGKLSVAGQSTIVLGQ